MASKNLNYYQQYRYEKLENDSQEEKGKAGISYFHHINYIFIGAGGKRWGGGGGEVAYLRYWDVAALDQ